MAINHDHRFTPQLVEACSAIMKSEELGALAKWIQISDVLMVNHIISERKLHVGEVLVSPSNKGGLGINAFNVHKNLKIITDIGTDKRALHKATCFEMHPEKGAASIEFNKRLIAAAQGLLAPLTVQDNQRLIERPHRSLEHPTTG